VPAEGPPTGTSNRSSVPESDGEPTSAQLEYEDHRLSHGEQQHAGSDAPESHRPVVTGPMCQIESRFTCRNLLPMQVGLWALGEGEGAAGAATEAP
jgi:hypothetical protein